jgi:Tol biopolymer transport system component
MKRRRNLALALAVVAALGAFAAVPAYAEFGPIRLVSKSPIAQAREASLPALSADGAYVAFGGVMDGGRQGVFEANLQTGIVVPVSTGAAPERLTGAEPAATATAPSISAEGRYVAFTTKAQLDPFLDPEAESEDVYVADMSTSPPTYALASIAPGQTTAIGSAHAADRVALSADGRKVAFVAANQVYVRDLATRETTLVSVERDPLTGAVEPGVPVAGGAVLPESVIAGQSGAAISADGSTVAWLATHVPAQVSMGAAEAQAISGFDKSTKPWDEPLWRRIADGPEAPTRRIFGGTPLLPVVTNYPERNKAYGWMGREDGPVAIPRLSADGWTVAMVGTPTEAGNAFIASMRPGTEWVRQLTRQVSLRPGEEGPVVNKEPNVPRNGHVYDLALSPNGGRVAFTTARQQFPLAPPNLVTPPPAQLGLVELFEADLENGSLRRVTHGASASSEPSLAPTGSTLSAEAGDGAAAPSFGGDGTTLAFASDASNLVAGDGNDASDVFIVEDLAAPRGSVNVVSTPPAGSRSKSGRRLVLSAFSMADGRVRLVVVPPKQGSLRAAAAAKVGAKEHRRQVADGRAKAKPNQPISIVLALPRRLRDLARTAEGLYGNAQVWFSAKGGVKLHASTPIRFHGHPGKKKGKGSR